jgi:hypothetical protein
MSSIERKAFMHLAPQNIVQLCSSYRANGARKAIPIAGYLGNLAHDRRGRGLWEELCELAKLHGRTICLAPALSALLPAEAVEGA